MASPVRVRRHVDLAEVAPAGAVDVRARGVVILRSEWFLLDHLIRAIGVPGAHWPWFVAILEDAPSDFPPLLDV